MKLFSWNSKGLGGRQKINAINNFVKKERPTMLLLQETKMEVDVAKGKIS